MLSCSDKIVMVLKAKELIVYPVHEVLLNFPFHWCCCLINNGHAVVGFTAVGYVKSRELFVGDDVILIHGFTPGSTVEIESFVLPTSDSSCRFWKMEMLHIAPKMLLKGLSCYSSSGFSATWKKGITGTSFPSVVSYCCELPEGNDMSCIRHGSRVQRSCSKCLVSLNDIKNLRTDQVRTVTETKEV